MPTRRKVPGIRPYDNPAGGWGSLRATARAVREQMDVEEAPLLLYRTNKPTGFDCPGCAWPDKEHTSTFQFCENGANYPEANVLVPLTYHDEQSGTPAYKSVPVRISPSPRKVDRVAPAA